MSEKAEVIETAHDRVRETVRATRFVLTTRYRYFVYGVTALYLLVYSLSVGDLKIHPSQTEFGYRLARNLVDTSLMRVSGLRFEPVALVRLPFATYLLSPVNVVVGLLVSLLVGINLSFTYVAFRNPKSCATPGNAAGALVSVPALLTGATCCAPTLFVVLGVQASATLLAVQGWLFPVAALVLLLTLPLSSREVAPETSSPRPRSAS